MKFPATNHKQPAQPVPLNIESNAKLVEEYIEKVNWKKFRRGYWYVVGSLVATAMLFILGIGIAHKLVSLL